MTDLTVNGQRFDISLPANTPLLSFLRNDLELNSPKFGCGLGECGACTVLVDDLAARACVLTLTDVAGRLILTLEGLGTQAEPHPVQAAFIQAAGAQCGYCLNGMIMTTTALLNRTANPTDDEIRDELRHNLCRCGAHVEIMAAVRLAASLLRETGVPA